MRSITMLISAVLASTVATGADDPTVLKQFEKNVQEYLKVRAHAGEGLPKAKQQAEDPAQIEQRQKALANAVQAERQGAKQGDIFTPQVRQYFSSVIRGQATGATKNATKEGNPKEEGGSVRVAVNEAYPKNAPLSTMPPDLLMKLPRLPKDLEFRFVGGTLILFNTLPGLIVDYIPNTM